MLGPKKPILNLLFCDGKRYAYELENQLTYCAENRIPPKFIGSKARYQHDGETPRHLFGFVGIKFFSIESSFFWQAFKAFKSEKRFLALMELTFKRRILDCARSF